MDRNIKLLYHCAQAMHLPCTYLPKIDALKIELGPKPYYFLLSISPLNYGASIYIAKNKYLLNKLLHRSGFPVPKACAFDKKTWQEKSLSELITPLRFPLVAKPMMDTARGKDVLCNIKNMDSLSDYLNFIFKTHKFVQIEEFHSNLKEYRILVLNNRVIGVILRTSAYVIGDGRHTIEELIKIKNKERIRLSRELTISPLKYDLEYKNCLEEQGLTLQSIIPDGTKIKLCHTVNTGRGGNILSQGKKIHPLNAKRVCEAARAIGLNYVGFDLLCEDINVPFRSDQWIIIEANFWADATLHEIPNQGVKANVVNKIMWQLIYRHPFSYLYHLCIRSRISVYIKSLTLLLLFCLVVFELFK
ncbi:hypothetical protein [Legionella fallonii]|uniref:Putative UDP-N-acetylmuramyl tripeptide synthase n=1 Tax=Legionella fallonii LLAP-10 TaxID=1212491 RepID=A0A098G2D8_9GAMM|nr:hypothetical protein [Legionella fallonii]CEG56643.1 putative UDP-N-acetylmuramyl tripeptide synthase [Legionella fallonii LLAP-10]